MRQNLILAGLILATIIIGGAILQDIMGNPNRVQDPTQTQATQVQGSPAPTTKVQIEELQVGTGDREVQSGDTVVMQYRGTLEDGTEFDSSYNRNEPFTTQIGTGQVIQGWDQGIPGMKVGGRRRLTIPPELAYGEQGSPPAIPPDSTLIFEVELLEIQ